MKMIKNIIEYLIAISVIPAIVLTVINVTELKDVRNVQYELLSEEEGIFSITPGTYTKLVENKKIKNYELESNYPLITHEDMERATWKLNDDLKNEMYIDEIGQKRIKVNVGQITFDGSDDEGWASMPAEYSHSGYYAMYIRIPNVVVTSMQNSYNIPNTYQLELFRNATEITIRPYTEGLSVKLPGTNEVEFRQYLSQNPLTITYELMVKNPNTMIIESRDIFVTSDYVRLTKPNDFSNNPEGLLIFDVIYNVDRFEVATDWIYVYPSDITVTQLANRMVGSTLIYELSQPRLAEVYDFSKFRLVFDKNRIRVVFDVDDGYYLWEITKDDKMIPINGRHDLGNIWTVKFYVYEIQQPLIRTLVLLIPLIVVSGVLLYMFNIIKKKGISY